MRKIFGLIFTIMFLLFIPFVISKNNLDIKAKAFSGTFTEDFIRKPTYSVYLNDVIYFYDEYDGFLKTFNNVTKEISYYSENHINGKVIEANYNDGKLYLLTSNDNEIIDYIVVFDLINKTIKQYDISIFEINVIYNQIFINNIQVNEQSFQIISISAVGQFPIIIKIDENDLISKTTLKYSVQNYILFCSMAYFAGDNSLNIISVLYNSNKIFSTIGNITFDKLNEDEIETFLPSEFNLNDANVLQFDNQVSPIDVALSYFNDSFNMIITYNEIINGQIQIGAKLFKCEIGDSSDTSLIFKDNLSLSNKYLIANNEFLSIPNQDNNSISLVCYDQDYNSTTNLNCANNPKIDINYLNTNNLKYFQTKNNVSKIVFYSDPWQSKSNYDLMINEKTDLLQIATAKIVYNQTESNVEDYVYCMFTTESSNYFGFVKSELIEQKELYDISEFKYKQIIKVKKDAKLYSLPTKINEKISDSLSSKLIMNIDENSLINLVLDDNKVTSFISNDTMWLRVQVNNSKIGYVDCNYIVSTNKTVNFIIPNSTIMQNDTKVFISNSKSSDVTYTLNAGKRVKIVGSRDARTGLIQITFNNEYGDEFVGYIGSENIKTDNWSTLQIIGCILIAINTGLLILILIFKKRHLKVKNELYMEIDDKK